MSNPREPSFVSLIGMALVMFINSAVFGIAILITSMAFFPLSISKLITLEAMLFVFVGILNIIAIIGTRKGKLLTILRRTAIAGNAMFLLLGVQAIMNFTIIGMLLCFGAAAVNIVAIITAPSWKFQQHMICPECDYNLRGLTSRGCPECGWERKT